MKSIWSQTVSMPVFPKLQQNLHTDVLIIGGGITGILCAYRLREAGVDCALVEADRICGGVTQNTTAKLTSQHGLLYAKLLKSRGQELASQYLAANESALAEYRRLCQTIDCSFTEQNAYIYSMSDPVRIEREVNALQSLHFPASFAEHLPLPFPTVGAVCFPKQAQFHPLRFLAAITKDLPVYEHTKVLELGPDHVRTTGGDIHAKKVIVATHFPILNKHGMYFAKLYQHRSYVLALKNALQVDGMYLDEDDKGLSFRNQGELLILGGGSHRTGKKGGNWEELRNTAEHFYPDAAEVAFWATQDCMSPDSVPYIGQYSKSTPNLFVATGFNKWGMTTSMAAAGILTQLVQGKDSDYAEVFHPARSALTPRLLLNGLEVAMGFLTPTLKRCPHLGCALKWNAAEHSWDCPCHGSRFDQEGSLIDNPATDDLKYR